MPAKRSSAEETGVSDDHKIRERAYHLWEKAGRPHGQHGTHWTQAASEIAAEAKGKTTDQIKVAPKAEAAKASKLAATAKAETKNAPVKKAIKSA